MAKDNERSAYNEVFVSYSRKNKDFAQRIVEAIYASGRQDVWIDWEDIDFAEDWWEKIKSGIDSANNFVFLISPDSIESKVCYDEVDHAFKSGKRIIPVMHQEITDKNIFAQMHPVISQHNWLPFRASDDFEAGMQLLLKTIETDMNHVRYHTRLVTRAREWDGSGRDNSRLLTIGEHREAMAWLATAEKERKTPLPIELQREYLRTSHNYHRRRQQSTWIAAGVGLVVTALAILSFFLFQNSQSNLSLAEARGTEAIAQAQNAATQAQNAENNAVTAVALQEDAEDSAATATNAQGEALVQASIAADQAQGAMTARADAVIQAYNAENNAVTATYAQGEALIQAEDAMTARADAVIQAYNAATQAQIAEINAATAVYAQDQAVREAETSDALRATSVSLAATSDSLRSTSEVLAATSVSLRAIAEGDAIEQGETAVAALGTSEYRGTRVAEESELAANNALTAEANESIARGQALAVSAEQLLDTGNLALALSLSLESIHLNPDSTFAQGILNRTTSLAPWLDLTSRNAGYTPYEATFTPDGKYMLSYNSTEIAIYVWDLDNRSLLHVLRPNAALISDIRISADGRYLITASLDASVSITEISSGAVVKQLYFDYYVTSADMSPDGAYLAVILGEFYPENLENRLKIYDTSTWQPIEIPNDVARHYNRWRFNREGDLLIAPSQSFWNLTEFNLHQLDSWIAVDNGNAGEAPFVRPSTTWRSSSFNAITTIQVDYETSLAWAGGIGRWPNYSGTIINTGAPQVLDLHRLQIRSNLSSNAFEWTSQTATFMDFSNDATRILLGTGEFTFPQGDNANIAFATWKNRRLYLVDVASGGIITTYTSEAANALLGRFSPDRSHFATVNANGRIDIWNTATGAYLRTVGYSQQPFGYTTVDGNILSPAFADTLNYSPDGRYLTDGLAVWNLEAAFTDISQSLTLDRPASDLRFNSDSNALIIASGSNLLTYDLQSRTMSSPNYVGNTIQNIDLRRGSNEVLLSLARSRPNDSGNMTELSYGQVLRWDMSSSSEIQRSLRGAAIAYSADGSLALIHNQLWNLQTNTLVQTFSSPELDSYIAFDTACEASNATEYTGLRTLAAAISPDNQRVILSFNFDNCYDDTNWQTAILDKRFVLVFDVTTGAVVADLSASFANYARVETEYAYRGANDDFFAFSADSNLILSGQNFYDALTGELAASFIGHTGHVNHMEFSPDRRFAASASDDGTVILWDVQTTRPIRTLVGHTGAVYKVYFSPDENYLVSLGGAEHREVIVWALQSLEDLLARLDTSIDLQQLTCFERQQYGVLPLCSDPEYQSVTNTVELPELPTAQVRVIAGAELFAEPFDGNRSSDAGQVAVIGTTETEEIVTILASAQVFYSAFYQVQLNDGRLVWLPSVSTRIIPPE